MTNEELQKKIEELEQRLNALNSYATLPLDTGNAIMERLFPNGTLGGTSSTKAVQQQAVAESGAGTYNVAKPMTGFISITISGTSYDIPYY